MFSDFCCCFVFGTPIHTTIHIKIITLQLLKQSIKNMGHKIHMEINC